MGCGSSTASSARAPTQAPGAGGRASSPAVEEVKRPFAATYELKEKLGKGQYAVVHRVIHKRDRHIAAVKCIRKDALTKEDIQALAVEVKSMEMLKGHPNFVQFHDFYNEKDYFFLVMELITGGELFDRICKKERYTEREARALMLQLSSALAFAHARGIVHRDLKPENILLKSREDDTSVKLADLGFAKVLTSPHQLMTTPCGTPGYVAPEVISNKPYSFACDVWSLGVIFYILLCGYPPFSSPKDNQEELFEQIRAGRFKFEPVDWAPVSEGAKDLIKRMLVVDPTRRISASGILQHQWMQVDAAAIPDLHLGASLEQIRRLVARKRLKSAMTKVRSTVRMKMLLGSKAATAVKEKGGDDAAQESAFFAAAKIVSVLPGDRHNDTEDLAPSAIVGRRRPATHFRVADTLTAKAAPAPAARKGDAVARSATPATASRR